MSSLIFEYVCISKSELIFIKDGSEFKPLRNSTAKVLI